MKQRLRILALALTASCLVLTAQAQPQRSDAIWARTTSSPITLDGHMNEAAWAQAESLQVSFNHENGLPGSGYNTDGWPITPPDPIHATIKFLVWGDSLYIGIRCPDSSIGAGLWPGPAHWEGLLGAVLDRSVPDRPLPRRELFYAWIAEPWADTSTALAGALPAWIGGSFGGRNRNDTIPPGIPQSGMLKGQVVDAATWVQGTTNDDSSIDTAWTTEMKINLTAFGYNPTNANGDIIAWNTSIYDADWQWFSGADTTKNRFTINKAWAQGQWGGGDSYDYLRIFVRPDVTTGSGAVPAVAPDMVIPGIGSYAVPTIDGRLNDAVWNNPNIGTLRLKYGDNTVRNAYPQSMSYTSGQFQPQVNGATAAITDPGDATIKYFYAGDTLYLGFNVKDKVVQSIPGTLDRWDGVRITINDRSARNGDSVEVTRPLTFIIDSVGGAMRMEDLAAHGWDSLGTNVKVAAVVQGTVDTMATTPDTGYTAEMKINLRKLGYPAGRGDGSVFFGATLFDGDSYGSNYTQSYGSRVWFARESPGKQASAWLWMDPGTVLGVEKNTTNSTPKEFKLFGNYPNPFNPTTMIKFSLAQRSQVTLEVYDILGRLVSSQNLGVREAGNQLVEFNASKLASGVYTYRLRNATNQTVVGRMVLLK